MPGGWGGDGGTDEISVTLYLRSPRQTSRPPGTSQPDIPRETSRPGAGDGGCRVSRRGVSRTRTDTHGGPFGTEVSLLCVGVTSSELFTDSSIPDY